MREKTYTVTATGIGKPDYSREVSSAKERAGLLLKYGQSLKQFFAIFTAHYVGSPFAWLKAPLAPGETGYLVDADTGDDMPYTIPEGYTMSGLQDSFGFTEDSEVWAYFEYPPLPLSRIVQFSMAEGGGEYYRNRVIPFSSTLLDPTGAYSHEIAITVTNNGGGNLEGSFALMALLEVVGTKPLPDVKTVKCKHCQHRWDVPVATTKLICPQCGRLTIVFNLSSFKGTV